MTPLIQILTLAIWGCIPELSSTCTDMTNSSSTYLGIIIGAIIGIVVSWWVYYRQKKTTEKQDELMKRISELEQLHSNILKRIETVDKRHDETLRAILNIERKLEKRMT